MNESTNTHNSDDIISIQSLFVFIKKLQIGSPICIQPILEKILSYSDMYIVWKWWKLLFDEIDDIFQWLWDYSCIQEERKKWASNVFEIISLDKVKLQSDIQNLYPPKALLKVKLLLKWINSDKINTIIESDKANLIDVFDMNLIENLNSIENQFFERIIHLTTNDSLLQIIQRISIESRHDEWESFENIW